MQNFLQINVAYATGPITSAPTFSFIFSNILQFLLSIVGILGIIGLGISGILYLLAAGDMKRISLAKQTALASVTGIIIALGALVLTGGSQNFSLKKEQSSKFTKEKRYKNKSVH